MRRTSSDFNYMFPLEGLMLTDAAGEKVDEKLKITVYFEASQGRSLTLNGASMENFDHCRYRASFLLEGLKNTLEVVDSVSGEKNVINVYYLKKGFKGYHFSLDDNIWFLQNLNENKDIYQTMFEDPYLRLLKTIHEKYGTKFHVNIYYETPRHGGFNLSQMTDRYKEEFKANSGWLRLCFHANADVPNRPYACATYEQVAFEAGRVNREILRFAGEEAFTQTVMTVHWGDISVEGARALRDLGYKGQVCTYNFLSEDGIDIRSYLDGEQCAILKKYGFYYDKEEDIYHYRYNGGIQHIPAERIPSQFDEQEKAFPYYQFKDICLHEQYFYPEYAAHQPNYYEKMDNACSWCRDHGYSSYFMDEVFEFNSH